MIMLAKNRDHVKENLAVGSKLLDSILHAKELMVIRFTQPKWIYEMEKKGRFASVVYLFMKDMMPGKAPLVMGNGEQERDFVFIEDVVGAAVKAVDVDCTGIVNVGTGSPTSFNSLIKTIADVTGKDVKPMGLREGVSKFYDYRCVMK